MGDRLILEIEVPDFNVDGAQEAADEFLDGDVLAIVTEEWMREEVGMTFVTIPGEKNLNSDFEVHSRVCRIVGARIASEGSFPASRPNVIQDSDNRLTRQSARDVDPSAEAHS